MKLPKWLDRWLTVGAPLMTRRRHKQLMEEKKKLIYRAWNEDVDKLAEERLKPKYELLDSILQKYSRLILAKDDDTPYGIQVRFELDPWLAAALADNSRDHQFVKREAEVVAYRISRMIEQEIMSANWANIPHYRDLLTSYPYRNRSNWGAKP